MHDDDFGRTRELKEKRKKEKKKKKKGMNVEGRERDTVHHRDGVITTSALPPLENQKKKKERGKKKNAWKRSGASR